MLIIGITGGSGSGKTTVVKKVMSFFSPKQVTIVSQDSYYKDNSNILPEARANINFDHPESIEFDLLVEHLKLLRAGKAIEEPVYDYITSTRQKETIHIEPNHVIIVEGILLFVDKGVRDLCDIKVFVDAEPDDRLIRIIERDMRERGRTAEQVIDRYGLVKEMHIQFIEPTKRFADVIIPQGGQNQVGIDVLVATIKQKLWQEDKTVVFLNP
ncbi:MAG: uridine kinase [Chitinophagales bacterium]|jgi:uridine kinase|nr:uridine kinase [Chitinophagales bacterium]MBP6732223.1 uridine kinase [Chitinophagales bacterium]